MQHSTDFLALCEDARRRVPELSVEEAAVWLDRPGAPVLIDVREADEYSAGHLPGAHHLSKGWIEAKVHTLVSDKDQPVILYCGGGNRSLLAADNLQKMGYSKVYSMQGGYRSWILGGKPIQGVGRVL